jgi:hypothetical protein
MDKPYFVKHKSGSSKEIFYTDTIKMLECLIDKIFDIFYGRVIQQTVGMHMGTNRAPLLADFFSIRA